MLLQSVFEIMNPPLRIYTYMHKHKLDMFHSVHESKRIPNRLLWQVCTCLCVCVSCVVYLLYTMQYPAKRQTARQKKTQHNRRNMVNAY